MQADGIAQAPIGNKVDVECDAYTQQQRQRNDIGEIERESRNRYCPEREHPGQQQRPTCTK